MDKNVSLNLEFLGPSQRVADIAFKLSQIWYEEYSYYNESVSCGYSCSESKEVDAVTKDNTPGNVQIIVIKVEAEQKKEEEDDSEDQEEIDTNSPDWLQILSEKYEAEALVVDKEVAVEQTELEKLNEKITSTYESIKKLKLDRLEGELQIEERKLAEQNAYIAEAGKRKLEKQEKNRKLREYNMTKITFLKSLKALHNNKASSDDLAFITKFRANFSDEANSCEMSAFGSIVEVPNKNL